MSLIGNFVKIGDRPAAVILLFFYYKKRELFESFYTTVLCIKNGKVTQREESQKTYLVKGTIFVDQRLFAEQTLWIKTGNP